MQENNPDNIWPVCIRYIRNIMLEGRPIYTLQRLYTSELTLLITAPVTRDWLRHKRLSTRSPLCPLRVHNNSYQCHCRMTGMTTGRGGRKGGGKREEGEKGREWSSSWLWEGCVNSDFLLLRRQSFLFNTRLKWETKTRKGQRKVGGWKEVEEREELR